MIRYASLNWLILQDPQGMIDESNYRLPDDGANQAAPYGNAYDNRPLPTKAGSKNNLLA